MRSQEEPGACNRVSPEASFSKEPMGALAERLLFEAEAEAAWIDPLLEEGNRNAAAQSAASAQACALVSIAASLRELVACERVRAGLDTPNQARSLGAAHGPGPRCTCSYDDSEEMTAHARLCALREGG